MSKAELGRQQFNIFDKKLPVIGWRLVDKVASKPMRVRIKKLLFSMRIGTPRKFADLLFAD
jgi:hypothetical protein